MFTKFAKYYDIIYAARGKDYAGESEYLHRLIQTHKRSAGNALLDVACGTGGHLVFLKEDYQVAGVDYDESMLEIARAKLPGVLLKQANMVDFSLSANFDIVICLFSSIAYSQTLDNMKKAVSNMVDHTNPGGLVIVEPWFSAEEFKSGTPHATYVNRPDIKIARMNVNEIENGISILDFHYLIATGDGIEYFQETHKLGLFNRTQYTFAFEDAGLKVVYDEKGLQGRGLYIGKKSPDTDP